MPFTSRRVANQILLAAQEAGVEVTPLKLQKLVYFAHGWSLALFDRALINEQIEAWKYGPVVPSLYHDYKSQGDRPLKPQRRRLTGRVGIIPSIPGCTQEGKEAKAIIRRVVETYGKYDGLTLSSMTHNEGTPWSAVAKRYSPRPIPASTDIPPDTIRAYFARQRTAAAEPSPPATTEVG